MVIIAVFSTIADVEKRPENQWFSGLFGGDKRDRTADLLNAMMKSVISNRDVRKQNYILTPPALAICVLPAIINSAVIANRRNTSVQKANAANQTA